MKLKFTLYNLFGTFNKNFPGHYVIYYILCWFKTSFTFNNKIKFLFNLLWNESHSVGTTVLSSTAWASLPGGSVEKYVSNGRFIEMGLFCALFIKVTFCGASSYTWRLRDSIVFCLLKTHSRIVIQLSGDHISQSFRLICDDTSVFMVL